MPPSSAKDQFGRQASHYNARWNSWTASSLDWLLTRAACQPTDTVLDVATGTGFTARAFAPHVQSVVRLDVSPGMPAQAARNQATEAITNVSWWEGAAEALPFPAAGFSGATCRIAPHHFQSVPAFLAEVNRVLIPGGIFCWLTRLFLMTTQPGAMAKPRGSPPRPPARPLAPSEWRPALTAAGLTVQASSLVSSTTPVSLNDWLEKAGCANEVAAAVEAFQIRVAPPDDYTFVWQRLVARAEKLG